MPQDMSERGSVFQRFYKQLILFLNSIIKFSYLKFIKNKVLRGVAILCMLMVYYLILLHINFLWLFGYMPKMSEVKNPQVAIATEIYTEEPIYYPTIVPTPMPDLGVQTTEQSIAPFNAQSLGESVSASGWSFPQNISQTESLSTEPSIAVDSANHLHIVWTELNSSGISDIYYKYQDEAGAWSSVVNVSKSNAFNSNNAQIITNSNDFIIKKLGLINTNNITALCQNSNVFGSRNRCRAYFV